MEYSSAKKSNTNKIQAYRNISLKRLSNSPPFISDPTLRNDFHMKTIEEEARMFYLRFHSRLVNHTNPPSPDKRSFHPDTSRKSSPRVKENVVPRPFARLLQLNVFL